MPAPLRRLSQGLELFGVAVLGAAQSLAYAHTELWALQLVCVAALAWRVRLALPVRAAALGAAFGTAWTTGAVWWLFISMHRYGGLPAWMAASAVLLLAATLSGYLALAMAAVARARVGRPVVAAALFACAWLAAELARGLLFTGFPWAASGYSQLDGPLAALAPWVGVYGIGACAAAVSAALAFGVAGLARGANRVRAALGLVGLCAALAALQGLGAPSFTQPSGTLQVTLLQPNIAQDEKFAADHLPAALAWVGGQLLEAQGDLVVAPETAVPLLPRQLEDLVPGYWSVLQAHFDAPDQPAALIGVPLGDAAVGYTNSVAGLGSRGQRYRYDKAHLVPFGEFIPPLFRWFTDLMAIPLGDFRRGVPAAPTFAVRGEALAPNICYEDLFGEELAAGFREPTGSPTVLVNLSNIGWFGHTPAPAQHLHISRMRSLELQRPMLRATNTGATAIIDHRARVAASLPAFSRGVLTGNVQGRTGRTPYAAWVAAIGLWPLLAVSWAVLLWAALRRGR